MARVALIAILALAPCPALAQTTTVDLQVTTVELHVTTTTPAVVPVFVEGPVVVEPPVVVETPQPGDPVTPVVRARGELLLVGGDYDLVAMGGSAELGARLARGLTLGIVVGYLSELGNGPSEIDLALEVEKDLSPEDTLGFLLLARLGTAFMLEDGAFADDSIRLMGQLGIGARVTVGDGIAVLLDLRGLLRYRPEQASFGAPREQLSGGAAITMGLSIAL